MRASVSFAAVCDPRRQKRSRTTLCRDLLHFLSSQCAGSNPRIVVQSLAARFTSAHSSPYIYYLVLLLCQGAPRDIKTLARARRRCVLWLT
jgi:hypothetical protein